MINLIFIHGINYQTNGYSNWLFQNILEAYGKILRQKGVAENEIEQKKAQFVQKEILWADVTTDLTNRYLNLEYELYGKKKGLWNWASKKIDPLVLQIMYYIKDKGDKASGAMGILEKIDKSKDKVPYCDCGGVFKPNVVLFGEMLPNLDSAIYESERADLMLAVGSSLQVSPANMLPQYCMNRKGKLVIINFMSTHLDHFAEVVVKDDVCDFLPAVIEILKEK